MSMIGKTAPDFTLPNTAREAISLSGLRGKKVVLAFYPAAFTGVCEKELCTFQGSIGRFGDLNARVQKGQLTQSCGEHVELKYRRDSKNLRIRLEGD